MFVVGSGVVTPAPSCECNITCLLRDDQDLRNNCMTVQGMLFPRAKVAPQFKSREFAATRFEHLLILYLSEEENPEEETTHPK